MGHAGTPVESRGISFLVLGLCMVGLSFLIRRGAESLPQDEPIVRIRGGMHLFVTGERVSLVDFLAMEVRRFRRRDQRKANDRSVGLSVSELRRRRYRTRPRINSFANNFSAIPCCSSSKALDCSYWSKDEGTSDANLAVERKLLRSPIMKRILVAERRRIVFCPISNVASGTLTAIIEKAEGVTPGSLPSLSDFSLRDRERLLTKTDIYRFTFVRHPFLRALAAYDRGVSSGTLDSVAYRLFTGLVRGRSLRDEEHELQILPLVFYLSYISQQKRENLDELFLPQVDVCGIGSIEYNMVGRLERFEDDIRLVQNHLNLTNFIVPPARQNSKALALAPDIFLVHKHRAKAAKLYKDDLAVLDYNPFSTYKTTA
jgi:hypothetical protein